MSTENIRINFGIQDESESTADLREETITEVAQPDIIIPKKAIYIDDE